MPYTKILNIDELRAFIKENIEVKVVQAGRRIIVRLYLEGKKFSEDEIEINHIYYADELYNLLRNDIWNSIRPEVQDMINRSKQ